MKQAITAKLKLYPTAEQFHALHDVAYAYRDGLNYVSGYAARHGKMSNQNKLQAGTYDTLRTDYKLPSQLACSVCRQVGASYKTLWTKVRQNSQHRAAGHTKRRYKGLDKAPRYVSPTVTYNYPRDYSFKTERTVSINTLNGRVVMRYDGYNKHLELIQQGSQLGEAKLWYDKPAKRFYLLVTIEIETVDPTPEQHRNVVGVDVGMRYLAVVATTNNKSAFYSGKAVKQTANKYRRIRKALQRKDTRSATRRLVGISLQERRFKLNVNHTIAKSIVSTYPNSIIGIEDLTNIRERTERAHREKASTKQRKANRHKSTGRSPNCTLCWLTKPCWRVVCWSRLMQTTPRRPKCGYTAKTNRPNKGLMFECVVCGYNLHADLIGARNIAMRTLLIRQDWMRTGGLSCRPDVTNVEAKAARLQKYAELRWSSVTSHSALADVVHDWVHYTRKLL